MSNHTLFELRSVGYQQQGTTILADVDWRVDAGNHWAILGPNGSGKSTLLKIATGYLWHTQGEVLRLGKPLTDLVELRRNIGWVSADVVAQIPPREIALETVVSGKFAQFGLRRLPSTLPSAADFRRGQEELARLDCESLVHKPFGVLSQGERQQVLVARTRMAGSMVLVLDEPCAGMDPGVRERFLTWLDGQLSNADFPTVLMATHHLEEIVAGIGHALCMRDGRILNVGKAEQVIDKSTVESIYDTPLARLVVHRGRRWPLWDLSAGNS